MASREEEQEVGRSKVRTSLQKAKRSQQDSYKYLEESDKWFKWLTESMNKGPPADLEAGSCEPAYVSAGPSKPKSPKVRNLDDRMVTKDRGVPHSACPSVPKSPPTVKICNDKLVKKEKGVCQKTWNAAWTIKQRNAVGFRAFKEEQTQKESVYRGILDEASWNEFLDNYWNNTLCPAERLQYYEMAKKQ